MGAKFMNLAIGGASHFYRMQRQYKVSYDQIKTDFTTFVCLNCHVIYNFGFVSVTLDICV